MPGIGHPILLVATGVLAALGGLVLLLAAPPLAVIGHGVAAGVVLASIATIWATAWQRNQGRRAPLTPAALSFVALTGTGLVVSAGNMPLTIIAGVSYLLALNIYTVAINLDRLAATADAERARLERAKAKPAEDTEPAAREGE